MGSGDPNGKTCEWCRAPAKHSFEIHRKMRGGRRGAIVPTGMFVYACEQEACKERAERITEEPRPALRKS